MNQSFVSIDCYIHNEGYVMRYKKNSVKPF